MLPTKLSDIRPQYGGFKLEATGETEHRLRKVSLDDYEWIETTFGMSLEELFAEGKNVKTSVLTKLIFHQLEDKKPFLAEDRAIITDAGESETVRISGLQKFREAVINPEEAKSLAEAFLKTIGLSQPLKVEVIPGDPGEKKKEKSSKPRTGRKS